MTDDLAPGRVSKLGFTESEDGRPVGDLEPLSGHDPRGRPGLPARAPRGRGVGRSDLRRLGAEDYRLVPDFTHEGTVRTFTVHAESAGHSR